MKRNIVFLFCLTLFSTGIFAQSGFSYQAVIRQADGTIRANETLNLTAELLQSDAAVYTETHVAKTNEFGAFTIIIGDGATGDTYSPSIFLNTDSTSAVQTVLKITEEGGNVLSETNIMGVPFAEVAKVALTAHTEFPVGVIMPFAGPAEKIPAGWMICNGDTLSKAEYPELFDVIGINWGEPTLSAFNLPDLRGVFLRGVNGPVDDDFKDPDTDGRIARNSGGAIGNNPGSYQVDDFEEHNHDWANSYEGDDSGFGGSYNEWTHAPGPRLGDLSPVMKRGGNETRPANAYVNYIIKY